MGTTCHVEFVMGTAVSFDVRDGAAGAGITAACAWLHHVHATYSTHNLATPISRYGLGLIKRSDLPQEAQQVLDLCNELRDLTDGVFDPWSVRAPNGALFDPSGLVKGWAAERAAEILEQHGCANFTVNAGGDIVGRGTCLGGRSWTIGVQHPFDRYAFSRVLELQGRFAVATSGLYERGTHITDPRTMQPAGDVASVTILGPSLMLADVLATAVFAMGEAGLDWLVANHPSYEAFMVVDEHQTKATLGFLAG